jgi:hypothetical protein
MSVTTAARVREVDSIALQMIGHSAAAVLETSLTQLVKPAQRGKLRKLLRTRTAQAVAISLRKTGDDIFVQRIPAHGPESKTIHLMLISVPRWRDAAARLVASDRKRLAANMHRSVQQTVTACELFCRALVDSLAELRSPLLPDATRVYTLVSQALQELRFLAQTLSRRGD